MVKNSFQTKGENPIFYKVILILLPVFIFILIELILRLFGYGESFRLFVNAPEKQLSGYKICNPNIGKKYFQKLDYTSSANDFFLKEKPQNGFRIFVMGSSTAAGFPYGKNLMFSKIVQQRLQDMFPEKKIEIVNVALTAVCSYTLLDFTNDILHEKPDAILFYAGQNEFYGALGVGSNESMWKNRFLTLAHLDLMDFRFYQLIRNVMTGVSTLFSSQKSTKSPKGTLMSAIAQNKEIGYKSEVYNKGIDQFRENLSAILQLANQHKVPVFLSEVVSNIKDIEPFTSVKSEKYPLASIEYKKAQELEKQGRFEEAKKSYYMAKDLDGVRFRASEDINEVIRSLANEFDANLVPMQGSFEKKSPNGIIGNNLLTEHVHPNIEGYFLMADVFFNQILVSNVISRNVNSVNYRGSDYYKRNWGYTALDSLVAEHKIRFLKGYWPYMPANEGFDYSTRYKPVSSIDSLAFKVFKGTNLDLVLAHKQLAEYYYSRDLFFNAFKEFLAINTIDPFYPSAYLGIYDCLMRNDDYSLAYEFIEKSLELEETYEAYFYKGQIHISKGEFLQAQEAFQNASKFVSSINREKLLAQLYISYLFNNQMDKANEVMNQLHKINPESKVDTDRTQINYYTKIPVQVQGQIKLAMEYLKKGETEAALMSMVSSLKVKETGIANRVVGELLLSKNDKNAIIFFLRAYPDFKNDTDFLYNLCLYYIRSGEYPKASEIADRISKINPDYPMLGTMKETIAKRIK